MKIEVDGLSLELLESPTGWKIKAKEIGKNVTGAPGEVTFTVDLIPVLISVFSKLRAGLSELQK
ncbi:MAG: hypothetical protein WCK82_08380 [Bacteroidota bacterium]